MADKISKADLDRGYSNTGFIPEDLEKIGEKDGQPELSYCDEEDSTKVGFLNRSPWRVMDRY